MLSSVEHDQSSEADGNTEILNALFYQKLIYGKTNYLVKRTYFPKGLFARLKYDLVKYDVLS